MTKIADYRGTGKSFALDFPALAAWQAKTPKARQDWPLDDLWRAACWEMNARDADADANGMAAWATNCRAEAARLVPELYAEAAKQRGSRIPAPVAVRRERRAA